MKKTNFMTSMYIALVIIFTLSGCKQSDTERNIGNTISPFLEFELKDPTVAKILEDGILSSEAKARGLVMSQSVAHMTSLVKIGDYGKGEVRIMGILSNEAVASYQKANRYQTNINSIVNYSCKFEYSYRNKAYNWLAEFPYR